MRIYRHFSYSTKIEKTVKSGEKRGRAQNLLETGGRRAAAHNKISQQRHVRCTRPSPVALSPSPHPSLQIVHRLQLPQPSAPVAVTVGAVYQAAVNWRCSETGLVQTDHGCARICMGSAITLVVQLVARALPSPPPQPRSIKQRRIPCSRSAASWGSRIFFLSCRGVIHPKARPALICWKCLRTGAVPRILMWEH